MKKILSVLCILMLMAGVCLAAESPDEGNGRKLTLMVYMCGSNLESSYGSATADIHEMLGSGFRDDQITLLVMTGGTKSWTLGFEAGETAIHEIRSGRQRTVWRSDQMNMGRKETLTKLLSFGAENYPAEDYALILWDHGGGPLEGVCWDELFSMDNLTLRELTEGIRGAGYPKKLSWIGFDACLMCSAEVARAVSPYAEYMIGSQETEPATGWNYAFLRGLEQDQNGGETGKRIVDAYFDSLKDSQDFLTMACVDLSKVDDLMDCMNDFFNPLSGVVSGKTFTSVSGVRKESSGFGQAVRAVGEDGYDLVDLGDLISRYGRDDATLQEALRDAVVVSRSNRKGASGLSVYHPYMNKKKYLESWRDDYKALSFSSGYVRYMELFGAMLTGEELVDWSGMTTLDSGIDDSGKHDIILQLTEEQKEETVSVQLMIFETPSMGSQGGSLSLAPVSVETARIDEYGTVSAAYRGRTLYVMDEKGNILTGPVSFLLSEDGETYLVLATYYDYSTRGARKDETAVLYHCRLNPQTNDLEIVRSFVFDWASQTYTNRIAFSEDGYTNVNFRLFLRNMPETDGAIPGYDEWESYKGYLERGISLPARWHLHFREEWEATDLYAAFQVTDVRQNTWSSLPVRIENPREKEITVNPSVLEGDGYRIRISAMTKNTSLYPSLILTVETENRTGEKLNFRGTNIVLNEDRMTSEYLYNSYVKPGEKDTDAIYLRGENLLGIDEVRTADFTVSISGEDYNAEPVTVPVHLELQGGDVSAVSSAAPVPLDEVRTEGILWQLVSLEQKADGSFSGTLFVRNETDEELNRSAELVMNGVRAGGSASVTVYPHTERYIPFTAKNGDTVSQFSLHVTDAHRLYHMGVNQALEQAGVDAVDRLELWMGLSDMGGREGEKIVFTLPEGLKLQAPERVPEQVPILEGDMSVTLESVFIADDGISVGLRMRNDTEESMFLQMIRPVLNGTAFEEFDPYRGIVLPPHTAAVKCLTLESWDGIQAGDPAKELKFCFQIGNAVSDPVKLTFPQGTVFGASYGTLLEAVELAAVVPAVFTDKPMALSETIVLPETDVQPLRLTAPMTEEEAGKIDSANVSLCLLGSETVEDPEGGSREMMVHRTISMIPLEQEETGEWTAELSGLALTADGKVLRINERRIGEQEWSIMPDRIYFYPDEESYLSRDIEGYGLFFDGGFSWYSDIGFTLKYDGGLATVTDRKMKLNCYSDWNETRSNCLLEEVGAAALEQRVFFGTDRMANVDTLDYTEVCRLSTEQPVTLTMVPAASLQEPMCLYYVYFYEDESRDDLIVDLNSGEILDRTYRAAE